MAEEIRVGVVGLRVMGRQHVRVLSELDDFEPVGVADSRDSTLADISGVARGAEVHAHPNSLLRGGLDAVVIANPT